MLRRLLGPAGAAKLKKRGVEQQKLCYSLDVDYCLRHSAGLVQPKTIPKVPLLMGVVLLGCSAFRRSGILTSRMLLACNLGSGCSTVQRAGRRGACKFLPLEYSLSS